MSGKQQFPFMIDPNNNNRRGARHVPVMKTLVHGLLCNV